MKPTILPLTVALILTGVASAMGQVVILDNTSGGAATLSSDGTPINGTDGTWRQKGIVFTVPEAFTLSGVKLGLTAVSPGTIPLDLTLYTASTTVGGPTSPPIASQQFSENLTAVPTYFDFSLGSTFAGAAGTYMLAVSAPTTTDPNLSFIWNILSPLATPQQPAFDYYVLNDGTGWSTQASIASNAIEMTAVPEPGAWTILAGFACLGVAITIRRRKHVAA